jgi:hypothetical protein
MTEGTTSSTLGIQDVGQNIYDQYSATAAAPSTPAMS